MSPNPFLVAEARDSTWRWTIAVATAVTVVMLSILPFVHHEYDRRLERDAARTPVEIVADDDMEAMRQGAVARWTFRNDSWQSHEVTVQFFLPLVDDPGTPPPGLPRWPAPGEVYTSPAVLALPGSDALVARYGALAGTLDPTTLTAPHERMIVVGVEPGRLDRPSYWNAIAGYGLPPGDRASGDRGYLGAALSQSTRQSFDRGGAVFVIAPLLVLLAVVARLGGPARDHALAVFTALGASRRQLARMLLGALARPLLAGAAAGACVAVVLSTVPWTVPFVGYPLTGGLRARSLVTAVACAGVSLVLVSGVVWLAHRPRRRRVLGQKLAVVTRTPTLRPLAALLAVLVVTNWVYAFFISSNADAAGLALFLGAATSIALLGPVTTSILARLSHGLVELGRRRGDGTTLLVGRELSMLARPAVQSTVFMGVVAVIATFATILMTQPSEFLQTARAAQAANADRSFMVRTGRDAPGLGEVDRSLPSSIALFGLLAGTFPQDPPTLVAPCTTQTRLGLRCTAAGTTFGLPDPDLVPVLESWRVDGSAAVVSGDLAAGDVLVLSIDGEPLDLEDLQRRFAQVASPTPAITRPQESWLVGAATSVEKARWITVGGFLAALLALATGVSSVAWESERIRSRQAVFAYFAGRRHRLAAAALGLVGLPLVLGAVIGGAVGVGISWSAANNGPFSSTSPLPLIAGLVVVTVLACAASTAAVTAKLHAWQRPLREYRGL